MIEEIAYRFFGGPGSPQVARLGFTLVCTYLRGLSDRKTLALARKPQVGALLATATPPVLHYPS